MRNKRNYTNKYKLPAEVVAAITKDRYTDTDEDPFDYSASTIVAPIQQTVLTRRYPDQLKVRDVVDDFWSFLGSIAHTVLEEAWHADMGSIPEKRYYVSLLIRGETVVVSGKTDIYAPGQKQIRDYKSTKVYKIMKGDYEEWEKAQNVYAFILGENGHPVESLLIIALLFNWTEGETYKQNYPECVIEQIPLTLWAKERQKAYIEERIAGLLHAQTLDDEELSRGYPCSKKEMWQDLNDVCIRKIGADRATRKFDQGTAEQMHAEAMEHFREKNMSFATHEIVERWSNRRRCHKFCDVSLLCCQHEQLTRQENGGTLPDDVEPLF